MRASPLPLLWLLSALISDRVTAFQLSLPNPPTHVHDDAVLSRRSVLSSAPVATAGLAAIFSACAITSFPAASAAATSSNGLSLTTAPISGLKWAEAKVGTGAPLKKGAVASIDYSMASTAGRFPQIYTTKDKGTPYRWTIGDGTTIEGIERAILGDKEDGIPPLLPGGIRRVIIPSNFGYDVSAKPGAKCVEGGKNSIGPIPPKDDPGAYQRWAQFYCNPRIPYQPDLVFDIKLYGKRTNQ